MVACLETFFFLCSYMPVCSCSDLCVRRYRVQISRISHQRVMRLKGFLCHSWSHCRFPPKNTLESVDPKKKMSASLRSFPNELGGKVISRTLSNCKLRCPWLCCSGGDGLNPHGISAPFYGRYDRGNKGIRGKQRLNRLIIT